MIADAIDGYLQAELLGGGMSRVYRAKRRRDGVVVAVKSVGLASDDVARAERRGAELQRQFHAVEARVPDVLDIRAGAYELLIEMEYIDGEDLSTVLRARGRFTPNEAVEVAAALADILDRAHRFVAVVDGETFNGIVHGDLKPRNIRVCATGDACEHGGDRSLADRVRVLDFGVAKGIRAAAGETRNVFGSAPYMSPERLMDGHVSTTSDCWSLGVVLCELLTGAAPYAGSERDVLNQIDAGPPPLPPDCPGDLVTLVHRLLARDLTARLTSAGETRDALKRWRETTRRTSPVGQTASGEVMAAAAAAAAVANEPNPTRRTEAGIGHAPTTPVSGIRNLPPIGGVPPLVTTGVAIPNLPGGETRRTQPTPSNGNGHAHAVEIPPIPAAVWQVPPIPTPSGPTSPTNPQVATGPTGAIAPVSPRRKSRIGRLIGISFLIVLIVIGAQVAGEMRIWKESSLLGGKVHAAEPDALDEMVETYGSLADRSSFGFGTWPARQPLREALAHHVDRVLLDFRQPEPTVREMQWKQARAWAAKALELGADDSLRARFLLCDAHVKRIDGDAAIYRGQADKGNRLLNEADSQFREASQLTRANPDAWLGLLRLHSGARSDPDQAQTDLNEAARRGWTAGARDYYLIGEATRTRAEGLEKSCDEQRTGERVKECLTQSRDLQKRAIEWYDKAVGLQGATKGGVQAQRAVDRLDARLEGLDEFSVKGLGLDLLRLAVRSATKHNDKPQAAIAPPATTDGTPTPPQEDQRP